MSSKDEILSSLHRLPSMPVVVQEVMASFRNENLDSVSLAHKIAQDQGLSAKMLRVANSSFYGLPRKIGSIQDAVAVMGLNSVRSLVLSAGFVEAFPPVSHGLFDRHAFWKRSFRVACYAQALAQCLNQDRQTAYTAGMFHDIGQLVLDICIPYQFEDLLQLQGASGASLIEIEQSQLGFDHAEIGAELARRWNFPPKIEHAIRYWYTPEHEPSEPATDLVYVAVLLERGISSDELESHLPKILRDRLKIDPECIKKCLPDSAQIDAESELMLAT